MSYNLILSEDARNDEINAWLYYEMQREGLGEEFLEALENCYEVIIEHPHLFGHTDNHKKLRDVKLKRFPFVIIYEISGVNILVYSVFYTSRRPK